MGQSAGVADRISAAQKPPPFGMSATILLTGFMPFGGERINPSWQVAAKFDRATIGGAAVRAWELPVNLKRAGQALAGALQMARPDAILGLGQAGGRTALSIEQV